jgi:hypothetical protein
MRTIAIIGVAIAVFLVIFATVFVVGGKYQQELFEDYVENTKNSSQRIPQSENNLKLDLP